MLEAKFSRALRFGENRLDREDLSCSAQRETAIPEYFLDAELEQFLNDTIEECYAVNRIGSRAGQKISLADDW